MNRENNSLNIFFIEITILLACCVCTFGIFLPIVRGKQANTIVNQYEILQ